MGKTESENTNPKRMGLAEGKGKKKSLDEIKKMLGLDKVRTIRPPIPVKKDSKHLYYVAGFFYPLQWETLERLKIPNQRILREVDRNEWLQEMMEVWGKQDETIDPDLYPFGYEE